MPKNGIPPDTENVVYCTFFTAEDISRITGEPITLNKDEALIKCYSIDIAEKNLTVAQKSYKVEKTTRWLPDEEGIHLNLPPAFAVILPDKEDLLSILSYQAECYGINKSNLAYRNAVDLEGDAEKIVACSENISERLTDLETQNDYAFYSRVDCREKQGNDFYAAYGGLLFLGTLFLMATALIIYYKQISEGYEDKERFAIMQKVGLSRKEVKQSIGSQVLTVFFLPLITAFIHLIGAFKMITRLLLLFGLSDIGLFALCTVSTMAVFALIYGVVYLLTSKTYYSIVSEFSED